ncbi:DUF4190 domain-containing protein [Paraoerskovia marina]|uniref:DUF4190 domain-containing protein n=1 Tax=Paraoerskovia marina TaxID=545619 RepID=UPI000693B16F|nr:DUF4190 domain-containing protein [Paraoerskovia marina]
MSGQTPDPYGVPDGQKPDSSTPPAYGQQPAQPGPPQYGQSGQPGQYGQSAPYGQPGYPQAPGTPDSYGQQPARSGSVPGKTMGIVGLVLAFFMPIVGLVLSIVAFVQSKKAGFSNGPALAGIILGAIFTILATIALILIFTVMGGVVDLYIENCIDGSGGTFVYEGEEFACE